LPGKQRVLNGDKIVHMDNQRGKRFSALLGSEMKGAIAARGHTATEVAALIGVERAAFNRYLNGHRVIPSPVIALVAEAIGESASTLVQRAWDRFQAEMKNIS
jgi:plasmid maintenance system antidote protein VapI